MRGEIKDQLIVITVAIIAYASVIALIIYGIVLLTRAILT